MSPLKQFLIALCGLPASGKTTLANAIKKRVNHVRIVNTDRWRDEDYYSEFTPAKEQSVRRNALHETQREIGLGRSVIHDDTNYYQSMRHELYEIAREKQCVFGIVHVSTPLDVALKWNRNRRFQIPDEVVKRIDDRLDLPGKKYLWDRPILTVDLHYADMDAIVNDLVKRLELISPIRLEVSQQTSVEYENRLLDVITRQVVRDFLQENPAYMGNPSISRIRREVLRKVMREHLSPGEIEHILRARLESISGRES